jgi:hypothetical protein
MFLALLLHQRFLLLQQAMSTLASSETATFGALGATHVDNLEMAQQ